MEKSCGGITGKNMNIPSVTIKELLEAGVHLGHKTFRWNQIGRASCRERV